MIRSMVPPDYVKEFFEKYPDEPIYTEYEWEDGKIKRVWWFNNKSPLVHGFINGKENKDA